MSCVPLFSVKHKRKNILSPLTNMDNGNLSQDEYEAVVDRVICSTLKYTKHENVNNAQVKIAENY